MKIPITDQFLWLLYNFSEEISDVLDVFRIKSWKEITNMGISDDFWKNLERKKSRRQFSQFVNYLKRKDYILIKENEGVLLTANGRKKCLVLKYKTNKLKLKKRKDGKWIMAVFDIPEKMRKRRDGFRKFLLSLGFQKFQKSIWVCPYDTAKELREIIDIYSLDSFIKIFIVQEIEIKN